MTTVHPHKGVVPLATPVGSPAPSAPPPLEVALPPAASPGALEPAAPGATVGGRGPASAGYLAVLGVEAEGTSGPDASKARLVALRSELGAVRGELAQATARLDGLVGVLNAAVRDADQLRGQLAQLESARRRATKKKKGLGALLTVAGFAVGGPLLGNLVGFATLKSVADMDKALRSGARKLADAEGRVRTLQQQRDGLTRDKAQLDARATALAARHAAFEVAADEADSAAPEARLRLLGAATQEARRQLTDNRALLGDVHALSRRAAALGVEAEALKASLQSEVTRLEAEVAALEREVQAAIFELGFAAVAAARGLGILAAREAGVLKAALRVARTADAPPEARSAALARTLIAIAFPADATLARAVAEAAVGTALAPGAPDPHALAEALASAGLAAAERALLDAALALPDEEGDARGLRQVVAAVLALPSARRSDAASVYRALAAAPAS
ncbi:MAG: hypothetical protein H6730_28385 [Deltaproteobacteria bacterium]|nr:hypothetical protein [Deltaproteobacteria bacterium]